MEKYAEGIYTFILKRKFLRRLILNVELNKVVCTFMENIHSKLVRQKWLQIFKEVAFIKKEKSQRAEEIKIKFAMNFRNKKQIAKVFKIIYDNYYVSKKLEEHFIKKMAKIRLKNYKRIIFDFLINNYNAYLGRYKVVENKIFVIRRVNFNLI
jgi:hypothetical protein